ncbi:MFS transporter [Actinomadura rupiterrae]|uniref:MFS transporter n=1 Tax=Actinomadura rupiterrae TaxID=559627 RepID=UPI0020A5D00C|nr:MFS transporter [Actinomadura rupiterrae]MCP2336364.1 putative MFS family arabinose efflux permease [Actinomadura rupiterrae]
MPSTATLPSPPRTRTPGWPAVLAVTLGIFTIVTTEILPVGLLTSIGSSFTLSDGTAGLMMTMPGYLAAVAAPTLRVATARADRRLMLCACMLLLAVANVLAASAPAFWAMLLSRVLVGVVIGGFWSLAAGLAERLVAPPRVPRATAVIFSSVPLGSVLGVPLGTLIGDATSWRVSFAVMAALSFALVVALAVLLPPLPVSQVTRLDVLLGAFRTRGTWLALALTALIVLAHFGTYTYVTPFLQDVTHVSPTAFLLLYGVAGLAGNFVAGQTITRHPTLTSAVAGTLIASATLALPALGTSPLGAAALLIVWGAGYGAIPVCSQTWFSTALPSEAASVLFTASFQATFSTGALVGGLIVDRTSPSTVMVWGGATATAMVLLLITATTSPRKPSR